MDTIAELREAKERAARAYERAEISVIGIARSLIEERRLPSFGKDRAQAEKMVNGMLDSLATAVDAERAAFAKLEAAQDAIEQAYRQQLGKVG